jgi:hypothetical protein
MLSPDEIERLHRKQRKSLTTVNDVLQYTEDQLSHQKTPPAVTLADVIAESALPWEMKGLVGASVFSPTTIQGKTVYDLIGPRLNLSVLSILDRGVEISHKLLDDAPEFNDVLLVYDQRTFCSNDPVEDIEQASMCLRATVCGAYTTLQDLMVSVYPIPTTEITYAVYKKYHLVLRELRSFLSLCFSLEDTASTFRVYIEKAELAVAQAQSDMFELKNKIQQLQHDLSVVRIAFKEGGLGQLVRVQALLRDASPLDGRLPTFVEEGEISPELWSILTAAANQTPADSLLTKRDDEAVFVVLLQLEDTTWIREKNLDTATQSLQLVFNLLTAVARGYGMERANYNFNIDDKALPPDGFVFIGREYADALCFALEVQSQLISLDWPKVILMGSDHAPRTVKGVLLWRGLKMRIAVHYGRVRFDVSQNEAPGGATWYKGGVMEVCRSSLEGANAGEVLLTPTAFDMYSLAKRRAVIPTAKKYESLKGCHIVNRTRLGARQKVLGATHIMWSNTLRDRENYSHEAVIFGQTHFTRRRASVESAPSDGEADVAPGDPVNIPVVIEPPTRDAYVQCALEHHTPPDGSVQPLAAYAFPPSEGDDKELKEINHGHLPILTHALATIMETMPTSPRNEKDTELTAAYKTVRNLCIALRSLATSQGTLGESESLDLYFAAGQPVAPSDPPKSPKEDMEDLIRIAVESPNTVHGIEGCAAACYATAVNMVCSGRRSSLTTGDALRGKMRPQSSPRGSTKRPSKVVPKNLTNVRIEERLRRLKEKWAQRKGDITNIIPDRKSSPDTARLTPPPQGVSPSRRPPSPSSQKKETARPKSPQRASSAQPGPRHLGSKSPTANRTRSVSPQEDPVVIDFGASDLTSDLSATIPGPRDKKVRTVCHPFLQPLPTGMERKEGDEETKKDTEIQEPARIPVLITPTSAKSSHHTPSGRTLSLDGGNGLQTPSARSPKVSPKGSQRIVAELLPTNISRGPPSPNVRSKSPQNKSPTAHSTLQDVIDKSGTTIPGGRHSKSIESLPLQDKTPVLRTKEDIYRAPPPMEREELPSCDEFLFEST